MEIHSIKSTNQHSELAKKVFADLTAENRKHGAVESHAYDLEQAADYIHLNKHYLTSDDLHALQAINKIITELSDTVLERIENDKDMS